MTKAELIKLMEKWPDDAIVRIISWPIAFDVEGVFLENDEAGFIVYH